MRYFPTWTQAQLEAALETVQQDQANGTANVAGGSGDVNFTNLSELSIDERRRRILNDLQILDPETYPPAQNRRITRSRARF